MKMHLLLRNACYLAQEKMYGTTMSRIHQTRKEYGARFSKGNKKNKNMKEYLKKRFIKGKCP